jgi:hypothetical protein
MLVVVLNACDGDEAGLPRIEPLDDLGKVGKAASEAIDPVDDDHIDTARIYFVHERLDAGPLHVAT